MPRAPRMLVTGEPNAVYHVISRTALDGYPIDDVAKYYLGTGEIILAKDYVSMYREIKNSIKEGGHYAENA